MHIVFIVIGLLCLLYGLSVMMVWSGTSFFAVWYVLAAVFFVLAWAAHAGVWAMLPLLLKRVAVGLLAAVFAVFAVAIGFAFSGFDAQGEDDLDYVVVLGAQVKESGPSLVLKYRLDTAYDYLQANPNTKCIVTGAQGPNEPTTEGAAMAAYLQEKGIDENRIIVEEQAQNTLGNITYSMEFFDPSTAHVGIITNNFHVFRGVRIAQKQGIKHVCGIAAPSNAAYLPNNMLREGLGIIKDFCMGNL